MKKLFIKGKIPVDFILIENQEQFFSLLKNGGKYALLYDINFNSLLKLIEEIENIEIYLLSDYLLNKAFISRFDIIIINKEKKEGLVDLRLRNIPSKFRL